jgi:hypothetical protein
MALAKISDQAFQPGLRCCVPRYKLYCEIITLDIYLQTQFKYVPPDLKKLSTWAPLNLISCWMATTPTVP